MDTIISLIVLVFEAVFLNYVLGAVIYVLQVAAYWRIFTKAGQPGWKSIIPIYNTAVQFRISWNISAWWLAVGLVLAQVLLQHSIENGGPGRSSLAVIVFALWLVFVISCFKLAKSFGHGFFFGLGLCILPTLFMLILGLGSSRYIGPEGKRQFKDGYYTGSQRR